jgi:(S)-ureidoglycine aminohydrolase
MLHSLGATRSSLKADHLLQTPDTFIRTPLPGAHGVEFIVHAGPRLGAGFAMMTAEFAEGGSLAAVADGTERFLYVLDGEVSLELSGRAVSALTAGKFAYLPAGTPHSVRAAAISKALVIEKRYQPSGSARDVQPVVGDEADVPSEALGGDEGLQVRHLMPDGEDYDFAVNTMTYDPGAALAMVEVHVMEHGLLMLEGGGIYRLGDSWYPVTAGDFIWMAPYCPQWFGALGKTPAKYLIYKDWFRHPLGA